MKVSSKAPFDISITNKTCRHVFIDIPTPSPQMGGNVTTFVESGWVDISDTFSVLQVTVVSLPVDTSLVEIRVVSSGTSSVQVTVASL